MVHRADRLRGAGLGGEPGRREVADRESGGWVAGAIGTGLTVAAVSDTCAMGTALSRMPWNRGAEEPAIHDVLATLNVAHTD